MNVKCPNCRYKFDIEVKVNENNEVSCICPRCGNDFAVKPSVEITTTAEDKKATATATTPPQELPQTQQTEPEVKYVYIEHDNKKSHTSWIIAGLIATVFIVGVAGWLWHDSEVTKRTELEVQMANQSVATSESSIPSGSSLSSGPGFSSESSTSSESSLSSESTVPSSEPNSSNTSSSMDKEVEIEAPQLYGRVSDPDGYTNIRRGPSTKYPVVGQCNSGDNIYYTPQSNGWSKVYSSAEANSFMGFVHTGRIVSNSSKQGSGQSPSRSNYHEGYIVDPVDSYVNVRKGPGTSYAIVGQLDNNTSVYYTTTGSNWYKVYDDNYNYLGYVHKDRIKRTR